MTLGSVQFGINGVNALIGAHFIQIPVVKRPSLPQLDHGFIEDHAPLFGMAAYHFRNAGAVNLLSRFGTTPQQGLSSLHSKLTAHRAVASDEVMSQYNQLHWLRGALKFIDCQSYLDGIADGLDGLIRSTEATSEPTKLTSDPVEQYVQLDQKLRAYKISPQQLELLYLLDRYEELKQIDLARISGSKVARGSLAVQLERLADKGLIHSRRHARRGGGRPNVFISLSAKGRKVLEKLRRP